MKLSPFLSFAAYTLHLCLVSCCWGAETQIQYLSGKGSDDTVDWEFKVSGGRQSGEWSTIPVPSNWEMQGFGAYRYFDDWSQEPAPDRVGSYRYRFNVPDWKDKLVDIVFDGSMTDSEVKINGVLAGPIHQGGFYRFRYDVSKLLKYGEENLLEVEVQKYSTNRSINRAERQSDFWLFGGIFRPVWLEARPAQSIQRLAIDARHTGDIAVDLFINGATAQQLLKAQVYTLTGEPVGEPFSAEVSADKKKVTIKSTLADILPWSAEFPNRYQIKVQLTGRDGKIIHEVQEKFGFRTIEVRPRDGFYVNGAKVRLRGANRHSFWPTTGRTTNAKLSINDVRLIKEMNMNAVRMSHYPPDSHFLDACDELGLYVIDELTGWQKAYDTGAGEKLVPELIHRDVNHPSIVLWANGNEGGFNYDLLPLYAEHDPQQRTVIHPWLNFNGLNTSHYEVYDCCTGWSFHGEDLILPTEFLHGLYDGGAGAGLDDWWNLMLDNPLAVGGFLWAFADEGIVREDQGGGIDVAGNSAPDGIVGPYREKEGSFAAIKEIWSPVYLPLGEQDVLPPTFDGTIRVENRYDFTDLRDVKFDWQLVNFSGPDSTETSPEIVKRGQAESLQVPPRGVGTLKIAIPEDWSQSDALRLTATDPHGKEIYTWVWMLARTETIAQRLWESSTNTNVEFTEEEGFYQMQAGETTVRIDRETGRLQEMRLGTAVVPLSNGPRPISGESNLKDISHRVLDKDHIVEANYEGSLRKATWRLMTNGCLRLDYEYGHRRDAEMDYLGVTFDFPEQQVEGMRWLGKGPYRVWKNRLKGVEFGVWDKKYNDAVTGNRWDYPEFKGFHSNIYWAKLETDTAPLTIAFAEENLYLRLFTPGEGPDPRTTHVDFPAGDISFLHGIAPIGTKFHKADEHGPAGQKNLVRRHGGNYSGRVYFHLGE